MQKLEVFDPAMCCSTGVCGVEVDPVLAQFSADLQWVEAKGVSVARHNLGQEPQAFAAAPYVKGVAFEAVGRPSFYGTWLAKH